MAKKKPAKPASKKPTAKAANATPKKRRHEQLAIAGTEPPETPEVRDALHKWLDDSDEHRQVGKRKRMSHDVLIAKMQEHGIERYPYTDTVTGKKKHVYAKPVVKATVINAPKQGKKRREPEPRERPDIDAEIDPNADKVESRRVSRESVEAEIDPFANVRSMVEKAEATEPNNGVAP